MDDWTMEWIANLSHLELALEGLKGVKRALLTNKPSGSLKLVAEFIVTWWDPIFGRRIFFPPECAWVTLPTDPSHFGP